MIDTIDWEELWNKKEQPPPEPNGTAAVISIRSPGGPVNPYVNAALTKELDELRATTEGSRNDQLNKAAFALGRYVGGGELDENDVIAVLEAAARDIGLEPHEIINTCQSGIREGKRHPRTAPEPRPRLTIVNHNTDEPETATSGDFWDSRLVLSHIRDYSYARMCSPWAVLGVCMLRALATVPSYVVLPPLIGGYGSLNTFIALVAKSSGGKGTAERAAKTAIEFIGFDIYTAPVGSGEGIAHQYAHRATAAEQREQTDTNGIVRDRDSVLFTVAEVDTLTALGNRQGSTLLTQLRSAFSGERLGFGYADATRRIPIEEDSYRLGMTVGVQPEKAGPLLWDSDGGTPQRFIWLPAGDPNIEEEPAEPPAPLIIDQRAYWPRGFGKYHVLEVPEIVAKTIRREHVRRSREESDALDGHALFAREKIAFALTVLDERRVMTEEDWDLSETIMIRSDITRAKVKKTLDEQLEQIDTARAKREAGRALVVAHTVSEAAIKRVGGRVAKLVSQEREMRWSDLRRRIAQRDREHLDEAVERLVLAGQLDVQEHGQHRLIRHSARAP